MNQTANQRRELKRAIPEWREYSRRVNGSNAHRSVQLWRDLAKDVIGGLLLIPLALAITFSLVIGVELFKGAL